MAIDPPLEAAEPAAMLTDPPSESSLVLLPLFKNTEPLEPLSLAPAAMVTAPLAPVVELPEEIDTEPELPATAEPLPKDASPLPPLAALAVLTRNDPLTADWL